MCSLIIECVLLLYDVFSCYRMYSLTVADTYLVQQSLKRGGGGGGGGGGVQQAQAQPLHLHSQPQIIYPGVHRSLSDACVCVCVCACAYVCMCVRVCMFARVYIN